MVCLQRRHFPLNHDCLEGKVEANFSRVVMAGLVAAVVFKVGHPGFCVHQHGWSCLLSFRGIFGLFSGFLNILFVLGSVFLQPEKKTHEC